MGFDPVPWMVGGGARHSVNVCRNVSFAAFGGQPGIVSPADLEVRELATPGTSIRVYPGTIAIKNNSSTARDEMYVGRMATLDTVPVQATSSGGGRSDLVVARVENPYESGEQWSAPSDPASGPYIFTRIITGVSNTTTSVDQLGLGYSAEALARIDIPAGTSTITQNMIKPLRRLSQTQVQREFNMIFPTGDNPMTSLTFINWPPAGNMVVTVPTWATHAKIRGFIAGVGVSAVNGGSANVVGGIRTSFVGAAGTVAGEATGYNVSVAAGTDRQMFMCGQPLVAIAAGSRGKAATVQIEANRSASTSTGGRITTDASSAISLECEFIRLTTSNV